MDNEQLIQDEDREKRLKSFRRHKKFAWFLGICGLLLLIVGIVMPIVLYNFIKSQAKDQVVMTSSNESQWGQIPGDTDMMLERQFVFYNFQNPEDFYVKGDKPVFKEGEPVYYQEYQNFTSPTFNDNKTIVNYNYQTYFYPIKNSTGQENQTVLNFGPMGFWYQIKSASRVQIGIQAFYGLISGLTGQLLDNIQAGILNQTAFSNQETFNEFISITEPDLEPIQDWLYSDKNYGMPYNPSIWMIAYKEYKSAQQNVGQNMPTCQFLINYFKITNKLLQNFFVTASENFDSSIQFGYGMIKGYSCGDAKSPETEVRACLAACQWSTLKPALGQSIVTQNKTAVGNPEIISFLKDYFKTNIDSSPKYQTIEFPLEWSLKVTQYIQNVSPADNKNFTRLTNTLLNQGNLNYLFTNGELYDKTQDPQYLENIAARFEVNEQYFTANYINAAYVFWEYCKYIVDIFAEMKNYKDGGPGVAGLTGVASQGLYTVFSEVQNKLAITIIEPLMLGFFMQNKINTCSDFVSAIQLQLPANFCGDRSPYQSFNTTTMETIYECYMYGASLDACSAIDIFFDKSVIDKLNDQPLVQQAIAFADNTLYTQYSCMSAFKKCSYYEIAAKQWYNMEIIRNLPPLIASHFPPGRDSLAQWLSDLPHAFEWGYYMEKYGDQFQNPPPQLSYDNLSYLLGFDMLFSGTRQIQMFLIDQNFEQNYYVKDPSMIRDYLRWITIFTAFELTQTRSAEQLLSGYTDKFLQNIATMNPQAGGDPSTGYTIMLNDVNMTDPSTFQPQSMYTGKGDVNLVRQYIDVNNISYTTFNKTYFDGFNDPTWKLISPWETEIQIKGTDAGANRPDVSEDTDLPIYVTTLYTGGIVQNTKKKVDFHGLNSYRYEINGCILRNKTVCPANAAVYANEYDYSINLTSIQQAPIFNTKTHMLGIQPDMSERIVLYNKDGNLQYASEWDDTYILVEPFSGTSLSITLNLQGVFLLTPDLLFNKLKEPVMMPLFYVYRSGNFTSSKVDSLFGDLKTGLLVRQIILYIGCILGGLLLLGFFYCLYRIFKIKKELKLKNDKVATEGEKPIQSENYI